MTFVPIKAHIYLFFKILIPSRRIKQGDRTLSYVSEYVILQASSRGTLSEACHLIVASLEYTVIQYSLIVIYCSTHYVVERISTLRRR